MFVEPFPTPPTPRLRLSLEGRLGQTVRLSCVFKSKKNRRVSVPSVGSTCPPKNISQEQYLAPTCH